MLTFDEATHSYFWCGQRVPGVTSILAPLTDYSSVPRATLDAAATFGKAVHLACELDDLGELDEGALDPALAPYLKAWRDFSRDHEAAWIDIEKPGFHETLRYAGTPDRRGLVRGVLAVVDIKTTAKLMPTVGPQLAAYDNMQLASPGLHRRIGVQLRADGTYHAEIYSDPADWPVFASLLTLRNWCARHNINPNLKELTC